MTASLISKYILVMEVAGGVVGVVVRDVESAKKTFHSIAYNKK